MTGRLKLWAKYTKGHVVKFNTGFNWGISSQTVADGGTVSPIADNQDPTGHREGYDLLGWSTTEGSTVADFKLGDGGTPVTGDITLYAVWKVKQYQVRFVTGEGGSAVAPQTVDYRGTVAKPADPTRVGYDFVSWVTDASSDGTPGNTPYVFGTPVTSNLTPSGRGLVRPCTS